MQERSDLDDELDSMQGSSDVSQERIHFLDRPGSDQQSSGRNMEQPRDRWKTDVKPSTGTRGRHVKDKLTLSKLRLPRKEVKSTIAKPAITAKPEKGTFIHINIK
jgi:hypothetical protein